MRSLERRAVAATALQSEADHICGVLSGLGYSVEWTPDGQTALMKVCQERPDALVADAVLPVFDGPELIQRLNALPLTVYPTAVLTIPPGMTAGLARANGRCAIVEKPVEAQALSDALEQFAPENRPAPAEKERQAEKILDALGVPEHPGRSCLLRAILVAWQDERFLRCLTTRLYPVVGKAFGMQPRQAERAMRHAIDVAWRSEELEAQYKIFGDTIDATRGNPTCGEMIAKIAEILRWEGRA